MKFMFPNEAGVYLHDNPERELFTEARGSTAAAASGSRMPHGWAGGCSVTISTGRGRHRAACAASQPDPGLHYLPDRDPRRRRDRLFGRRLRARCGEACGDQQRGPCRRYVSRPALGPPPVWEESDVLRDRAAVRIVSRVEPDILQGELAHQGVDRPVAARSRHPAVRDAAIGVDPNGHANAAGSDAGAASGRTRGRECGSLAGPA